MLPSMTQKLLPLLLAIAALWLAVTYLLPVLLPFGLGALLALAAEPAVRFGMGRLRWSRGLSAGVGVVLTLVFLLSTATLVGALVVKELGSVAQTLPDLQDTARQGMDLLEAAVLRFAQNVPANLQPLVEKTADRLFDRNISLTDQAVGKLPGMLSAVLSRLPGSAIGVGAGILSAFMISVRLPRLKAAAAVVVPPQWKQTWQPALKRVRQTVGGWLKAQAKLCAITWCIVTVGFWLLGIPHGPAWAVLVALVDAVPLLGTGTVLLPWALISLLQEQSLQAFGLAAIYGCAVLTRTVLEPRFVGKQIGLDPLLTLVFLYAGFRFWGVLGMIFAPMLAAAAKSFLTEEA